MRVLIFAVIALSCGPAQRPQAPALPAEAAEFPALRFAPDNPSYIVTSRTVREGQRSIADGIESFGMIGNVTTGEVSRALERVLSVDPLSADGAAKLGIDPNGGLAMFSEATDPTFVVHLAAPEVTQAFFDHLRDGGLRTASVIVEGVEINTTKLVGRATVSWAIDKDWLWAHFAFGLDKDPAHGWFLHARHPHSMSWAKAFAWAKRIGDALASRSPAMVGFFDSHAFLKPLLGDAPHQLLACVARFDAIGRVGFAVEGDGHHAAGRIAIELGPAAQQIAAALRPPPPGFAALAATAPLAVQWNLDLGVVAKWLEPCSAGLQLDLELTRYGASAGRAAIETLDPDDKSGTGVVSLDLISQQYVKSLLDQIPRRSMFESDRAFGAFHGHHLKIPFIVTLDYVLEGPVALAAMGDGLLDKLVAGAKPGAVPIAQLDVRPLGMSPEAWRFLLAQMTSERYAKLVTDRLVRWRDGRITIGIDHETIVIEAAGNRR